MCTDQVASRSIELTTGPEEQAALRHLASQIANLKLTKLRSGIIPSAARTGPAPSR